MNLLPQTPEWSNRITARLPLAAAVLGVSALGADAASAAQSPSRTRPVRTRQAPATPDRTQTVDLRTVALNEPITFQTDLYPSLFEPESPFREPETMLLQQQEVGLFVAHTDISINWTGSSSGILDDPAVDDWLPGSFGGVGSGHNVRDAVRADIDSDGRDEMVVLTRAGSVCRVFRVDVTRQGQSSWQLMSTLNAFDASTSSAECSLTVGDFDGDRRDEIAVFRTNGAINAVGNTSSVWVLDDPVDGSGILYQQHFPESDAFGAHNSYSGIAADVDGDGDSELILKRQGQSGSATLFGSKGHVRFSMLDWSADSGAFFTRVDQQLVFQNSLPTLGTYMVSKGAAGQFDGDSSDEIVLFSTWPRSSSEAYLTLDQYNYNVDQERFDAVERGTFSGNYSLGLLAEDAIDVCAFNRYGDNKDWIAICMRPANQSLVVRALRLRPSSTGFDSDLLSDDIPFADRLSIAAGDSDANGSEELYVGATQGTLSRAYRVYGQVGAPREQLPFVGFDGSFSGGLSRLIVAPGEYDGDGLRVRYEGSTLRVSNPVPLTLLAAVPTKAGINQNYGNSGTGYSVASGMGVETSYTTSTTITGAVGFEIEDITGTFGASVKATIERESSTTQTSITTQTDVVGYNGSADEDVMVFISNNYLVHEYTIMDAVNPAAEGQKFTIDVPLETRVDKWAVPYYNARVPAPYRITSDLLPHTIGDPASYRSFAEMANVTSGLVSWNSSIVNVGQGTSGSVTVSIELASEDATTAETTLAGGVETSFKAWGVSVEGSVSLGDGKAYTVSTNSETTYSGEIGDISASDYATWQYGMGLSVYQAWRVADDNNQPTGEWLPGGYPLTVIDFWTDPFGAGY